jgi:hypothetical protein
VPWPDEFTELGENSLLIGFTEQLENSGPSG